MISYKEILRLHLEKMGLSDNLIKLQSIYAKGNLEFEGSGLSGKYEEWKQFTDKIHYCKENVDLGMYKQVIGYNGNKVWKLDDNGKISNITTESLKIEYYLKGIIESYQFIENELFNLDVEDDNKNYIILIKNSINNSVTKLYINKETLLLDKRIDLKQDETVTTQFSNYQLIEGVLLPFEIIEQGTNLENSIVKIISYDFNNIQLAEFEPPKLDVKDFEFTEGDQVENIPFDFLNGHIYVDVFINGHKGRFILDSGAGKTLLDSEFCKKINLKTTGSLNVKGVGNKPAKLSLVKCDSLLIQGVEMKQQTLISFPLSKEFEKVAGLSVEGLLGFDFFSRFITKIDFANQLMHLFDPEKFNYNGSGSILSTTISNNIMVIPLTVDNQYKGNWAIDTGAKNLSFHYPFAKENDFIKKEGLAGKSGGVGGEFTNKKARFKNVIIGNFKIDNPAIAFPTEPMKGTFASKAKIGNLGTDLLRHFIVYFDYKNNRIILEKGMNFNNSFPENHSGLGIEYSDQQEVVVNYTSKGTPAQKAGLLKDDIILTVNKQPVEHFNNLIELKNVFMQPFGTIVPISIKRNDEVHHIEMKLEKII